MTDWIGETFTSTIGWDHLEALVDIGNRMAGSDGEREGLELTRDALAAAGARNAHIDEFEIQGWERGESSISIDGATESCIALPRSPNATATGELVDLGYGLPEDFDADVEGKIVMVSTTVPDEYDRFIHRREKYYYAVENGAAGFIFANHVSGCLPPTGSVGTAASPIGDVPAVGVSNEVGSRLARRYEGESVTIDVDCDTPAATSGNAIAELGPDTDAEIIVSSHVDAHDIAEGAMDNGAGTATVIEIARALAARESALDTRVRFICYGSEEVGLVGSSHEAERADHDAIRAIVNIDSNVYGRTLKLDAHGFDALEAAGETVSDRFDHPISMSSEIVPHSDHWPFVQWGVPGYMVSGETEDRGRGWGHTFADTIEKLEPRNLREQAILLTELVVELAGDDVEPAHRSPESIAAQLEAEDLAEGMKVTGDWPY
ncbi:MAG: M28 family peptidase [Halobacteriota archaeon]